jgi:hypothetical protein
VAGLVVPLLPWVCAVIWFIPRHSGGGCDDVEMVQPGQDHPAAAAATKQREMEKEDRYWAWVCVWALAGALLLAGVVGGLVAYDRGLISGI